MSPGCASLGFVDDEIEAVALCGAVFPATAGFTTELVALAALEPATEDGPEDTADDGVCVGFVGGIGG